MSKRRDISVVREAITKVVNLLTNRSIKVTQRGAKAYVAYNPKTGAIQLVNIPYLPDDASDAVIAATQGFLDHEVGHVLFTDRAVVVSAAKLSAQIKNIHNLMEDVYVENKMVERFRGAVGNLEAVRKFHIEQIALPKIKEALAVGDLQTASAYAGALQFRAWGGQTAAIDFFAKHPEIAALTEPMAKRLGPEIIAKIGKLKSSKDALELAKSASAAMTPPKPEAPSGPPEKTPPSSAPKPSTPPPATGSDDVPPDEDDCEKPVDEGTTGAETDDSEKKRDEASKSDEEGKEGGDSGEGDDSKEGGDTEEAPRPKDPEFEAAPPSDDAEEESEGEGEEPGGEGDGTPEGGEEEGEGEDTPAGPSTPSGEEGPGAEDDESGGKFDTSGSHIDESPESADEGGDEDGAEDLGRTFSESHDFDEETASALSSMVEREMRDADYCVFSTDWDSIEFGPLATNESSISKMVDETEHMVAGIQKQLERAMAAKDRKTWNPGLRRGRISPGALFKTAVGDDRVFRQRYQTQAKNTAVSLLVDCSGSMSWSNRIGVAAKAAYALSSTLDRLKIRHEVLGFTTKTSGAMTRAIGEEGMGVRYSRKQALYMPLFKGFDERTSVESKSRIAHLTEHPGWLNENVDGECVQIAGHRLRCQRAERHILIVLSDGAPACPGDGAALNSHLVKVVKDLTAGGVEVVGIGIETESVRKFYPNYIVLRDLSELPTTVVGQLTKLLLSN